MDLMKKAILSFLLMFFLNCHSFAFNIRTIEVKQDVVLINGFSVKITEIDDLIHLLGQPRIRVSKFFKAWIWDRCGVTAISKNSEYTVGFIRIGFLSSIKPDHSRSSYKGLLIIDGDSITKNDNQKSLTEKGFYFNGGNTGGDTYYEKNTDFYTINAEFTLNEKKLVCITINKYKNS